MRKISFKGFNQSTVTDETGKEMINFKKIKSLPARSCYLVMNTNHETIGKIKRIDNNFCMYSLFNLPQIIISVNNNKIILRKDIQELKDVYEITGNNFSIIGSWKGPHFDILQNEKVLASVDVQKEETEKTYLVDVIDNSNEELVICILFALSWII